MSELIIGGRTFRSRLFVGTGKFSSNVIMSQAIAASETEMVTVAMKRIDMANPQDDMLSRMYVATAYSCCPTPRAACATPKKRYWRRSSHARPSAPTS